MCDSSSDSESDCFESATESLDENDDEALKIKSKKFLRKSERNIEQILLNDNSGDAGLSQDVKNLADNSVAYRKRPERTKNNSNKSPTKIVNQNKINQKVDAAPDIFLQDLTSNFSKNINKSFSSLQQTSSNVKDLIFNSLPLSNVKETVEFSYDDNNPLPSELELPNIDLSNEIEGCKTKEIKKIENCKHEKVHSYDTLNVTCEEENTKLSKLNIEPSQNENIEIKSEDGNKNMKLVSNNSDVKIEKNLKCEYQNTGNNQNSDNIKENEKSSECIDFINNTLVNQKSNPSSYFQTDFLKTNNFEVAHVENLFMPEIKNLKDLNAEFENNDDDNSDTNLSETTGRKFEATDKGKLVETFKNTDAFVKYFEEKKQPEFDNDFENNNKKLDNLESHVSKDTSLSNLTDDTKNFNENNKEIFISKNDCLSLDQFKLKNEALTKKKKNKNDSFKDKTKQVSNEIVYKSELQKSENKCSENLDQQKESNYEIGDTKNDINIKQNVQFEELESSLAREKEITDGWEDDFSFSESDGENVEETRSKYLNKNETQEMDIKNLEIRGKHVASDSLTAMSEEEYQESDMEEIRENETKGPIEDWDWDTWDDVDDPNENINSNIVNKKFEIENQEISGTERWPGWDNFGSKPSENQSNWGMWGVNMLLNKASAVTQGISSVVEAGLGAPDPESLARIEKLEKDSRRNETEATEKEKQKIEFEEKSIVRDSSSDNSLFPVFGLTNLVAGVTSKIVEHSKIQEIGSKVITGGLDTLESFGKKTMEVLQDGDPGLKNKRALLLGTNKPILSQVLKEAKEKAEKEIKKAAETEMAKKCHFEGLFDDFQGMVHLEALEMLSTQSLLKLEQLKRSMTDEEKNDLNVILEEVEQLCYLEESDIKKNDTVVDFKLSLTLAIEFLKNEISSKKIIEIQEEANKWLDNSVEIKPSPILVHQKVVTTLAQLTAATIHQFHKAGELLSVKDCRKTVEEIEALSKMTNLICTEIIGVCERFTKLSENLFKETGDFNLLNEKINSVMTDSTSFIKQAFNLLIPVLQVGAAA